MTFSGIALVLVPFTSPADSLYQFMALGIVFLGVPVYFVTIRGILKPKILTKLNGKLYVSTYKILLFKSKSFDKLKFLLFHIDKPLNF